MQSSIVTSPVTIHTSESASRRKWMALVVVCLGQLMMVVDMTIVNVALPVIQRDLRFSQADLTWVVGAYLISYGSFLLMAGRLGDLVGRKRVFLSGVTLFTIASALCGVADSQLLLIAARFLQGLGGAIATSVIIALIVTDFPRPDERVKAMGAYMFVVTSGGSLGLLLGGALVQSVDWHWIFYVNLPIGVAVLALGARLIENRPGLGLKGGIDATGSVLVTTAMMVAVYAIVTAADHGWASGHTLGFGGAAAILLAAFAAWEARIENPILPVPAAARADADRRERRPRLPRRRHVRLVGARHAVRRARARLRRVGHRPGVPADDADRRRAVARHHRAGDGQARAGAHRRARDVVRRRRAARG